MKAFKTFFIATFLFFSLSLSAQDVMELYQAGINAYANKHYDSAFIYFESCIKQNPPDSITYYIYLCSGDICDEIGEYENSVMFYTYALGYCQTCYRLYNYRGAAYAYLKDYDKAEIDFLKYLEYDKEEPAIYNNLGFINNLKKNYLMAVVYLNRAIELRPDYVLAFLNRGFAYSKLDNIVQAESDFIIGVMYEADNPSQFFMRGEGFYFLKKYKEAIDDWKKAIELNPGYKEELLVKINKTEKLIDK